MCSKQRCIDSRRILLKPRPHQQQCRSNIIECYKSNDSFDNVECYFDIVAVFSNNVAGFGNNVERHFVLSTKTKQVEHVQFVSTLEGRNFWINSFDIVAVLATKSNIASTKSNVASTLLLVWTGLKVVNCVMRTLNERRFSVLLSESITLDFFSICLLYYRLCVVLYKKTEYNADVVAGKTG